jgi:hypothetical protein
MAKLFFIYRILKNTTGQGRREKIPPKLTEDLGKIGHEIEPTVVYSALSPKNKKILKIF